MRSSSAGHRPTPAARQSRTRASRPLPARRDFLAQCSTTSRIINRLPEKPLSFKDGTGPGKLFDRPPSRRRSTAHEQGIDLLIGGSIQASAGVPAAGHLGL